MRCSNEQLVPGPSVTRCGRIATSGEPGENEILTVGFLSSLAKAHATGLAGQPQSAPATVPVSSLDRESLDADELSAVAAALLRESGQELDTAMRRHEAAIADRQAAAIEPAQRIQHATVMLVVARYGAGTRRSGPTAQAIANVLTNAARYARPGDLP